MAGKGKKKKKAEKAVTEISGTCEEIPLPKDWIAKQSRRHNDLVYYANMKTGVTTWVHPGKISNAVSSKVAYNDGKYESEDEEELLQMDKTGKFEIGNTTMREKTRTEKSANLSLLDTSEERDKIKLKWKPFGSSPKKLKTLKINSKSSEKNSGTLESEVESRLRKKSSDAESKLNISNDSGISIKEHNIIYGYSSNNKDNIPKTDKYSLNISKEENSTKLDIKSLKDKMLEKKLYEKIISMTKNKQQQQPQKEKNMGKSILDNPRPKLTAKRRQNASGLESLRATLEYEKSLALIEQEKSVKRFKAIPLSERKKGPKGEIEPTQTSIQNYTIPDQELSNKKVYKSTSIKKSVLQNEKSLPGLSYSSSDDENFTISNQRTSKYFQNSLKKSSDRDLKDKNEDLFSCDKLIKSQSNTQSLYDNIKTRNISKVVGNKTLGDGKEDQYCRSEISSLNNKKKGLETKQKLTGVSQVKDEIHHKSERNYVDGCETKNCNTVPQENASFEVMEFFEELSQARDQDLETSMEVDQYKQILTEINNYRGNTTQDLLSESSAMPINNDLMAVNATNTSSIFFVVDTNILLDDMMFLDRLAKRNIMGKKVQIVIPYTVIQELDGLKKSSTVGKESQRAIVWCNNHFENDDTSIQGQSFSHYRQTISKYNSTECDDRIRDCCLLLQSECGFQVCLVTNDVNLRNKALLADLKAFSLHKLKANINKLQQEKNTSATPEISIGDSDQLMRSISTHGNQYISSISVKNNAGKDCFNASYSSSHQITNVDGLSTSVGKPCKRINTSEVSQVGKKGNKKKERVTESDELKLIKLSLNETLGGILEYSAKDAFGDVWLQVILHKPPWKIQDIFACWEKHWRAIFTDKFSHEVENNIKKIGRHIKVSSNCHIDEDELKERVEFLYELIRLTPYKDYVHDVQSLRRVTGIEAQHSSSKIENDNGCLNINTDNVQRCLEVQNDTITEGTAGLENIGEMLKLVGLRCTQIVDMIIQTVSAHSGNAAADGAAMTLENAGSSAANINNFIMRLGTTMQSCRSSGTDEVYMQLGHELINFWSEAGEACPERTFTLQDIRNFFASNDGALFVDAALKEFEQLIMKISSLVSA